jgi:hypothetical protein
MAGWRWPISTVREGSPFPVVPHPNSLDFFNRGPRPRLNYKI